MADYQWSEIKKKFVEGDDNVTYASLSRECNAPSENAIRQRAFREKWKNKRAKFRSNQIVEHVAAIVEHDDEDRLADLIGMLERKVRHASILRGFAIKGIRSLNPEEQKLGDLVKLFQLAESLEDKIIDREFLSHLESIRNEV